MEERRKPLQPGFEKVQAPDLEGQERYAKSLDRSLTNDLNEKNDVDIKKEAKT